VGHVWGRTSERLRLVLGLAPRLCVVRNLCAEVRAETCAETCASTHVLRFVYGYTSHVCEAWSSDMWATWGWRATCWRATCWRATCSRATCWRATCWRANCWRATCWRATCYRATCYRATCLLLLELSEPLPPMELDHLGELLRPHLLPCHRDGAAHRIQMDGRLTKH